ncbi:MAG: hypothetical protein FJ121_10860 [Deltaproteobacteria bacterium]|nr:hypothetical protein [Deltaproteobacteria bacterium]
MSRMRGNSHVRFLGEGVSVMGPPYPTLRISEPYLACVEKDCGPLCGPFDLSFRGSGLVRKG